MSASCFALSSCFGEAVPFLSPARRRRARVQEAPCGHVSASAMLSTYSQDLKSVALSAPVTVLRALSSSVM